MHLIEIQNLNKAPILTFFNTGPSKHRNTNRMVGTATEMDNRHTAL